MARSVLEGRPRATALWLVAGLDPSAGAGLLRDSRTARACAPALPLARVVTAWTRQGQGRPATATPRSPAALARELSAMPPPRAVKVGLVPAALVPTVVTALAATDAPVVLDPVLAASDGGDLGGRADVLRDVLRDMAKETWLVTPNRREALALAGAGEAADEDGRALARRVAERLGRVAVLLKDAPGADPQRVRDIVCLSGQVHVLDRPRVPGPDPRGTGCALATAIACGLALGRDPLAAIAAGVAWLDAARARWTPGPDGRAHLPDHGPPLP